MNRLLKCRTCGGSVAEGAHHCPHCGEEYFLPEEVLDERYRARQKYLAEEKIKEAKREAEERSRVSSGCFWVLFLLISLILLVAVAVDVFNRRSSIQNNPATSLTPTRRLPSFDEQPIYQGRSELGYQAPGVVETPPEGCVVAKEPASGKDEWDEVWDAYWKQYDQERQGKQP